VRRGGFTLVEVMVALVVIGVAVAGARVVLGQLADDAERIARSSADADREAGADALLRDLAGRLELGGAAGGERRFEGQPHGARFHSWCDVPAGWLERCEVTLGILDLDGQPVLAVRADGADPVALRRGFSEGEILYLRDAGGGGEWVRRWGASITAPVALGVVLDGDTLIVRIGERG
jgi:prepilin-type N-terminal cleavage/methylation domain-containing protein